MRFARRLLGLSLTAIGLAAVFSRSGSETCAALAGSKPAFEVAAVDDAEHEEHLVGRDQVVHDPVVADAQAVEGVCLAADRLHLLAANAAGSGCCLGELFEAGTDPRLQRCRQLVEGAFGARGESNLVGTAQVTSRSGLLRPRR